MNCWSIYLINDHLHTIITKPTGLKLLMQPTMMCTCHGRFNDKVDILKTYRSSKRNASLVICCSKSGSYVHTHGLLQSWELSTYRKTAGILGVVGTRMKLALWVGLNHRHVCIGRPSPRATGSHNCSWLPVSALHLQMFTHIFRKIIYLHSEWFSKDV